MNGKTIMAAGGPARKGWICAVAVLGVLAGVRAVRGESIWEHRSRTHAFLFTDNLAAEIGDSLTVLIADNSSFTKTVERDMEKSTSHSSEAYLKRGGVDWFSPLDLAEDSSRTFESGDEHTGTRKFADSITVTVVDKLPNGNLIIAGHSQRTIAKEHVITVLTGIVRPEDVGASNTISSTRVAHARIYYETDDPMDGFVEPGLVTRLLNYMWPF